ncbi:hypothetical protein JQ604_12125 [Bradyrhizobium jicamae]|uniref:hypothetical protein n=1 Tax=Bradyrhizobium jicamae TaxID=280332 RepID=UPI001BAACBB0|nr:hypothetical protein [Bradyrhizobium jicamae]MBR0752933.1 hypothetical protein [Bradyrhizobium jicamae]
MSAMSAVARVMEMAGITADVSAVTTAELEKARSIAFALGEADAAAAVQTIRSEAIKSARTRLKAILTHAEAAGRDELAHHLAFDTDLPADTAIATLRMSAKTVTPRRSRLDGNVPDPKIEFVGEDPRGGFDANQPSHGLNAAVDRTLAQRGIKPVGGQS